MKSVREIAAVENFGGAREFACRMRADISGSTADAMLPETLMPAIIELEKAYKTIC